MKNAFLRVACCALGLLAGSTAHAVPFQVIRIGDVDGFGYQTGTARPGGFTGGTYKVGTAPSNADGLSLLAAGDRLPSLNGNTTVATGSGDDFDNRSSEGIAVVGAVNTGSTGVDYTDIALSTSYDASKNSSTVWNHNTGSYGAGGLFPSPPSTSLSNQPGFLFDFFVGAAEISAGADVYFNLVFGDYDVNPAQIRFTFADGTTSTLAVGLQNQDGLIQEASLTLAFAKVFTGAAGGYDGYVKVDFLAPNEPYTAFDFVELSVIPDPGGINVPDRNSSAALLGLALFGLLAVARGFGDVRLQRARAKAFPRNCS